MKREEIEAELREKLEAHRTPWPTGAAMGSAPLLRQEVESLVFALLPWVMEIIEHERADERISCGELL